MTRIPLISQSRPLVRNLLSAVVVVMALSQIALAQSVQSFQSIRLFNPETPANGITIQPPTGITSYSITLPATAPAPGTALLNNGAGVTTWATVPTTISNLNSNRLLISSSGSVAEAPALTNGQILVGSTGAAPVASTITAGSGISITSGAGSITIASTAPLPTGTTTNSTLRYNGTSWVENPSVRSLTDGSLEYGATTVSLPSATPVYVDLGSSLANDRNPTKMKLRVYNDGSNFYGFGVTSSSFDAHAPNTATYRWNMGTGATPTEVMSLTTSRLTLPSTVDLSIKGVSYTWPTANGAAGTVLTNNGSGTLTWTTPTAGWGLTGNASTNASTNFIGTTDAVDFVVRTNNTERMRVLSGGNVGIGTTAPAAPLEVRRTVTAATEQTFISLYAVGDQQNHGSTIDFRNDGGGYYASIAGLDDANNDGRLELRVSGNSAINGSRLTSSDARLTIKRTGFVGIGTTAPSQLLTVTNGNVYLDNSGTAGELRFREPSASGANYTAFRAGAQAADLTYTLPLAAPTAGQLLSSDASGNLSWTSAGASGWGLTGNASTNATTNFIGTTDNVDFVVRTFNTERMRVLGGGNVTLGGALGTGTSTATPVTLSLGSTFASSVTASQAKLRIFENSSGSDIYGLGVSSSQLNYFAPTGATHRWYVNNVEIMSLSSTLVAVPSSNMAIGTSSSTERLTVSGNIALTGSINLAGTAGAPGTPSVLAQQTTSGANTWIYRESAFPAWGVYHYNTDDASAVQNSWMFMNGNSVGWSNASFTSIPAGTAASIVLQNQTGNAYFAGNIGINTTAPTARLHVTGGNIFLDNAGTAGELRFREPSGSGTNYTAFRAGAQAADLTYTLPLTAPTAGQVLSSDASGNLSWTSSIGTAWALTGNAGTNATNNFIGTTDAVDLVVRTNNTERMRVLSGGNVGIGTASPGSALTVSAAGATTTAALSIITTGSDLWNWASSALNSSLPVNSSILHVLGRAQSTNNLGYLGFNNVGAGSASNFLTFGFWGSDYLVNILASGNMGIGTTTPSQKLTVMNGNMFLDNSGTAGELRFREPSGSGTNYTAFRAGAQAADLTYTLPLTAPTAGQVLSSDASGNLSWTSSIGTAWALTGNAGTNATNNFIGTTDAVDFVVRTSNTERLRVLSGGNVGIGTASPGSRLTVSATGSGNIPALSIVNTGVDTWNWASTAFNSSMPAGGNIIQLVGQAASTNNSGYIGFNYSGVGSLSNFLTFGLYANDNLVNILASGNMGIGTTTPSQKLTVMNGNMFLDNSGTAGELRFREPSGSGTNYTAFRAGAQAANLTYTLPTTAPTAGQLLSSDASGNLSWASIVSTSWGLTGNASTNAANNFIGTTDAVDLVLRTNNTERMRVLSGGNVILGGPLSGGFSTATPVSISLGGSFASSPVASQAKIRVFEASTSIYGFGVSDSRLNYFAPSGATHRWYISDVLVKTLDNNGYMTLVGASPGIGTDAATDLLFRTNNTERMRIASGGNITFGGAPGGGVSTATPLTVTLGSTFADAPTSNKAKLRIFESSSAGSVYGFGVSANQLNYFSPAATTHRWYIGDVEMMSLSSTLVAVPSSNMAIGTSSSTERLTVSGNIALTGSINLAGTAGAPGTPSVLAQQTTSGANTWIYRESGFPAWGVYHYNTDDASAVQNSWMFMNGGSVGWSNASFTSIPAGTAASIVLQNQTGNAYFAGNIGINTTAPTARLHVTGGNIFLDNAGTAGELRFREPSGSGANYTAFRAGAQAADLTYTLPTTAPTAGQFLSSDASGNLSWANTVSTSWGLTGNAGTNATNNFIGTTDAVDLVLRTANTERMRIQSGGTVVVAGNLSLGTAGSGASTATPITIDMGSTFASDLNPQKAKLKLYSDASGFVYGFGVSSSSFNSFVHTGGTYRWYHGSGATPTELLALSSTRLSMPSTVDLTVKGVAYTWPTANGAAGTVLSNDGSGTLTWAAPSAWALSGSDYVAGTYAPTLNGLTYQFVHGDKGSWIGTRNAQSLWFGVNSTYRASIATDGTFTMSGPLVVSNLSSAAATTLPVGYDRVLIGNASGQIEEVGFAAFADATNTGWGINGNTTTAGTYAPSLNGSTLQFVNGDRGPWVGTRNSQPLWFATNNTYRAQIAVDGTFTMSGPLVVSNLSSAAGTTLPAGYDRVLIGNASGQIEEVGFTAFADATNTGWGINGNATTAGTYAPSLNGSTLQFVNGDRGPWVGTRNSQPLWFATNNTYRAQIAVDGTFTMSGPLVVNNLSSAAGTTLPAGYDRVLIGNASGQIEEVGFTAFADATNTGWGINGNTTAAGTYVPSLNGSTVQFVNGDRGPWVGTRNLQPLWFATNNTYRAQIAVDGTFTMSGPLVVSNLSSAAGTTLPAGYDRVLIGNASGQIEEVGFAAFADATNTGWGINGNTTTAGTYAPSLNGSTVQFVNGDRGPWVGTRNSQPLWFATNNTYRAQIAVDGTFTMSGPLVISNLSSTAGTSIGSNDRVLVATSAGAVSQVSLATLSASMGWSLTGNGGTNASTNFIGTTDAVDFVVRTSNAERMRVLSGGNVGIGTTAPSTLLQLGNPGTLAGTLSLSGSTSGRVTINTAAAAGTWTMTLPASAGSNGQVLSTNGSGVLSWIDRTEFPYRFVGSLITVGDQANGSSANFNAAFGVDALDALTSGTENAAFGYGALTSNTTGFENTAVGNEAMRDNQTGVKNTAVGDWTLANVTTGSRNIALGYNAGLGSTWAAHSNRLYIGAIDGETFIYGNMGTRRMIINRGFNSTDTLITANGPALQINTGFATNKGLVVKGETSQSQNLMEFQNSGGTVLTSVSNEGSVSVGGHITATPGTPATVAADNTAITVGAKSFLRITSNGTPANRTITLSNGLSDGQILVIRVSGGGTAANGIELADAGNLVLTGTAQLTDGSTIVLIWDSNASWFELMRSIN